MADLLQKASDWLEDMRTRSMLPAPSPISAVAETVVVSATIGKTVFTIDEGTGVGTEYESRDFLILAAELVLGGSSGSAPARRPHPGDARRARPSSTRSWPRAKSRAFAIAIPSAKPSASTRNRFPDHARNDRQIDGAGRRIGRGPDARDEFSLPFTAEWKDNPIVELADPELRSPRVWVVDFAETAGDGARHSHRGVRIALGGAEEVRPERGSPPTECRKLSGLVSEIATFCRNTAIAVDGEEAVCVKIERERARDFKEYHEKLLFRAEISTHWQKVGGDDE